MSKQPKRTVRAAHVEGIGPVSADYLLSMDENSWGIWRDRITDRHQGKDGLTAHCWMCDGAVYIKTANFRGVTRPLFAHYSYSDPDCPWYHGRNISPDGARASQYQGRQESDFHRLMCEQVAELVSLDARYIRHTVAEYLPPTKNKHGRFPDIYVEWSEFGPFAVEFQMSGTFETEISARCKHYEYEGIPLLWILFGLDTTRPTRQSFVDVIRRHRGNAFILDPEAIAESKKQQTLVLKYFLRSDCGFYLPTLVRFDQLKIPRSMLPYLEDRIVDPRLSKIRQRRQPWFKALKSWKNGGHVGTLCSDLTRPQSLLVAAAFSIVATANGKDTNFTSKEPNIRAALNTCLHWGKFARYTDLLTLLIKNTAQARLLQSKVGEHLRRYSENDQVSEHSLEWRLLHELLPEALDPVWRAELIYLDALPKWAIPPK